MNRQSTNMILVDSAVLPPVFLKVIEAKRLLRSGEAHTVHEAAQRVGISRTAFYKYKDAVFHFSETKEGRIITLQLVLRDEAGVLSRLIGALSQNGANILTISQNIPVGGRAAVSVSARLRDADSETGALLASVRQLEGVVSVEEILGE